MRFWLGGYTARSAGTATGIGTLLAGDADDPLAGGQLRFAGDAAATDGSPSWLAAHPTLDVIYAAMEDAGTVRAFHRTGETSFVPLGGPVAAGDAVCHVAVAPDGGSLVAACWGDGRVVRMSLDAAGRPSAPTLAAAAGVSDESDSTGPPGGGIDLAQAARALRAAAGDQYAHLVPDYDAAEPEPVAPTVTDDAASPVSRAHQAVFLPAGLVATTDLGLDRVRFWRTTPEGLRPVQDVALPLGTGPRHMVWHPSGHLYVVTEFSCEVYALAADITGSWRIVAGTPLAMGILPGDAAAELAASRDGEFLYAGVRGSNTIATLRVRGAGDSLTPVALADSGVQWPRHHLVVRDTLLVAGQRSDEVASLTLDLRTGVPGRVRHRVEAPSPTCLLVAR
ncbi:lactonase family protein [Microbacterium terregens]|uniref:Lactonase family protein n=1 Tax=Microbacterium terregens TaxID=69363 RepID=A0ABV5SW31_9MICO